MLSTSSGKYEEANGLSWDMGAKKKKKITCQKLNP